ncbi:MAG TPA: MFS transporter [Candidatus Saccharimonadales bacterium]|nr:MFS transporter [Candidatus Saccharimonadales bacterium]
MNKTQKLVLVVAILASFVAFLDGAVVNVALPVIQKELGGGLAGQQWVVDGYLLTLGSFILIAGSLSDLFGRLKVLRYGLIGFTVASLLCAIAPNIGVLIAARLLQGAAGAMLVPSSLALIADRIPKAQFSKAVGSWTAWTGISFLIGPLLGGFFVDVLNWRLVFAINLLPFVITLWLMQRLSGDRKPDVDAHVDAFGAALCTVGLAGLVIALIEQAHLGWGNVQVWLPFIIGCVASTLFIWHEARTAHPMLPLKLFTHRNFAAGNIATFAIYAGLSAVGFVLVIFLQQVAGYGATVSGMSLIPVTLIMFFGSPRIGALSERFGPRWFMTAGPLCAAVGLALIAVSVHAATNYFTQILPGVLLFALGLVTTVTPLTAAIIGDVSPQQSGIASAVNNAVARIAGLIAIAIVGALLAAQFSSAVAQKTSDTSPALAQSLNSAKSHTLQVTTPDNLNDSDRTAAQTILRQASVSSFRAGMLLTGGLVAVGGVVSAIGIRNSKRRILPT